MITNERPEKIGKILSELLHNLGLDKRIEEYHAFLSWDRVVGEKIAGISRPKGVRDGRLLVEVRGSVWMSEINMIKRDILAKLNEGKKRGRLRDIVLVQWREKNGKE